MRSPLAPLVAVAAAVAPPPQFAPLLPSSRYLPTEAGLRRRLAGLDRPARRAEVEKYLAQVSTRWVSATADGIVTLLAPIRVVEKAALVSAPTVPVGLPVPAGNVVPSALREDLTLDSGFGPALGRSLVTGALTPAQADLDGGLASQAIMGLRRLDDVLCRVQAAQRCATATGAELALVLALYRTEGALAMPPSDASIGDGIPSGTNGATTSLTPRPDISNLVWLANFNALPDLSTARAYGTAAFILQVAGLDVLFRPGVPFVDWSRRVWREATGTDNAAAALARKIALESGVVVVPGVVTVPAGIEVYQGTLTDPIAYVSLVLGEGVQLLRSLRGSGDLFGPGPTLPAGGPVVLGEGLAYLRYNLGDDQARLALTSALRAAARTTGPTWSALQARIRNPPSLLSDADAAVRQADLLTAGLTRRDQKAERDRISSATVWPVLRPWCAQPGNLDALTDFVERASGAAWSTGWFQARANVARFRTLLAFYRRLTGP